jgi:PqqD family protein of HPr-rel-A system
VAAGRPKIREELSVVELDGEAIVYDEARNELHHLNPTATIVLRLCDGRATTRELSADIADAFGAPLQEVEREVEELIRRFREAGLLEERAPGRESTADGSG